MITVSQADCLGCGECVEVCPQGAIRLAAGHIEIDQTRCNDCGLCIDACPNGALKHDQLMVVQPAEIIPAGVGRTQRGGALSTVGSALAYIGAEILPWALPIVIDILEQRTAVNAGLPQQHPVREMGHDPGYRRGESRRKRGGDAWTLGGVCICPNCGSWVRHQAGVPCRTLSCRRCGSRLIRQ
jgi:ferredoxin